MPNSRQIHVVIQRWCGSSVAVTLANSTFHWHSSPPPLIGRQRHASTGRWAGMQQRRHECYLYHISHCVNRSLKAAGPAGRSALREFKLIARYL
jgi:hypothetical protein